MKIIAIKGGLGNQMFQYALAYRLKLDNPEEDVYIDVSHFKGYQFHNYELKMVFDVALPEAPKSKLWQVTYPIGNYKLYRAVRKFLPNRKTEYIEPRLFTFWKDVLTLKGNKYIDGSWQNEMYFRDRREDILKIFEFKKPLEGKNVELAEKLRGMNSISIHVRRGNFLMFDEYKGICDLPYYKNAIEYVKSKIKNPHFYVFSNDAAWCKEIIAPLCGQCDIVDWNIGDDSYLDMRLMAMCPTNILAHSSFSWWAAWMNKNENKTVVAPYDWLRQPGLTDKPQLTDWILMKNE